MSKLTSATAVSVAVLAVLATLGFLTPASAGSAGRPAISLSTPTRAAVGTTITIRGKLSKAAPGLKVALQSRSGAGWRAVKVKKQGTRRAFNFTVKVRSGSQAFRVVTTKTKKLKAATSRIKNITGVAVRTSSTPVPATERDRVIATILAETNAYRTKAGRKPLKLHSGLVQVAQAWSKSMATKSAMVHNTKLSSQTPGDWRRIGENIGRGYELSAITAAWYASPGHKANLLGDFTHIGIGFTRDGTGQPWYVQDFAKY